MPSPPKPWERNQSPDTVPAVPARPMPSGFANRAYGSDSGFGTTGYNSTYNSGYSPYSSYGSYGTPYNRYGSYSSPYSRYGSYGSYGGYGSSYGSPFNRFGYGGRMGPPGPDEMSLTQRMEASTAAGFHMIESIVNAFGGFAQMLESTFFATHSSFMAMVGVVEQFGNLRNYLGQVLSIFALIRWLKHLFYKIIGKKAPVNPEELNPIQFEQFQEGKKYSHHNISNIMIPGKIDGNIIPSIEFCRALYDFKGESPVELTLKRGDIIAILKKTDPLGQPSQWWRGRLRNGENGLFPSNYVEIINKGEDNSESNNEVKKVLVTWCGVKASVEKYWTVY
ncbi:1866_t:CDS:2 [Diversispora eburnea]|uniref:Peroxisomal membrane protein PEX13 n=1 Tax=Diversispora eburnea TaxID=1213867 RepID=A0A9N9AVM5_9GLOM|nr:1866_t:CDS:2 [Diversispora eburnea]